MKKYFATTIIVAIMFSISFVSCTKDVSGTNITQKANAGNVSNMQPKHILIIPMDTLHAKP
jgi:hypothetical protein